MRGIDRIEESLCEKSMKVVSNVIKMSAFSISKRSLGSPENGNQSGPMSSHHRDTTIPVNVVQGKPLLRAHQPQANTKQVYMVEPEGDSKVSSSYVVKEDINVDGRASDFIRKVREKNQKNVLVGLETSQNRF